MVKTCTKCKEVKDFSDFNKDKTHKDGLQSQCKSCKKQYLKRWQEDNKEYRKKHYKANKEYYKEYSKKYYKANKEHYNEYSKKWREANKEYYNEYSREYNKKRKKTDTLFKLKGNLRSRTYLAFKNKGYSKNTKTQEILGVDWEVTKQQIERQFKKGMSWDNYGDWHIDHI